MKRSKLSLIVLSVLVFETAKGRAEDGLSFEFTADYFGKYVWRGQNIADDPVFQPGLSAACKSIAMSVWGNTELTNCSGNSGEFSEVDYSLVHSADVTGFEGLAYSIGIIHYDFPGTKANDTTEFLVGLDFDLPLRPSVTLYRDVDEADGSYVALGVTHRIDRVAELSADVPIGMQTGATVGWGSASYDKYYWGADRSKLNDLSFCVCFPVELYGWTVNLSLNYVTLISGDIRDSDAYGSDGDFFFGGIGFSRRF